MSENRKLKVNEVIDLLIRIDKYTRRFHAKKDNEPDKKKFEVEIKYFRNYFKTSQK
jgi:hypothetical protein